MIGINFLLQMQHSYFVINLGSVIERGLILFSCCFQLFFFFRSYLFPILLARDVKIKNYASQCF